MDWKVRYQNKLTTAAEAVTHIKSGDRVVFAHACGEPQTLVNAMMANSDQYENVEIVHMVAMGKGEYMKPEYAKNYRHNGLFLGGSTRNAVAEGRGDYTPSFFFEIPRLFKKNYLPVNVSMVQLSKPDAHGYCSYGVSCDYTKSATECADLVIAQINEYMPRTLGNAFIHVDDLDIIVEASEPLIELPRPAIGEIEERIGSHCASLVEDGSTLQLGIGAIPDAVLSFLKDKKDLGIHSEMFSDGVLELVENGNITNAAKSLHPGKFVVTFLMGSKKLYDFIDNNPEIVMCPVDYTNNPAIIAQNSKMVSINSAIQVDFMGQVASETIGYKQFSGTGGQVDFVRGASMCEDGKSIIAFPSVAGKNKLSRIVPVLDEGAAVTTSRNDVDYIVTEFGIAHLRGKSLKDRAKALINIAHPDHREELVEAATKRFPGLKME